MYKCLFILLTGFHIHLSIHWSLVSAACPWTFFGYCHVVAAGMVLNEEQGSINSVPANIEQLLTYLVYIHLGQRWFKLGMSQDVQKQCIDLLAIPHAKYEMLL